MQDSPNAETFYLCPHCFYASEKMDGHHEHHMVVANPGPVNDPRRKPVIDQYGQIASRAPRWFVEALIQDRRLP